MLELGSRPRVMHPAFETCSTLLAGALGVFAILRVLLLVGDRERVKRLLRNQGLSPHSISWRPLAPGWLYRATSVMKHGPTFLVGFCDPSGRQHRAHCVLAFKRRSLHWIDYSSGR